MSCRIDCGWAAVGEQGLLSGGALLEALGRRVGVDALQLI